MALSLFFKTLNKRHALLLLMALLSPMMSVQAQADINDNASSTTEVIVPHVDRREIKIAKIDSENIEITPYIGILSIEDFDSSLVYGVRAAVHLSERLFIEGSYGWAKGDKTSYEELSGGGSLITDDERDYTFWDVSFGLNLFAGEAWLFSKAYASNFYLIAGAGSTEFGPKKWSTINLGAGYRLFLSDWMALRMDVRDHLFNRDIFGEDDQTNNIEISAGLSFFF